MARNQSFRDQLRNAIRQSGLSCYRIAKETGIQQAQLSRFMSGERGLSIEGIEAICDLIGLQLVMRDKPKRPSKRSKQTGE